MTPEEKAQVLREVNKVGTSVREASVALAAGGEAIGKIIDIWGSTGLTNSLVESYGKVFHGLQVLSDDASLIEQLCLMSVEGETG
jgi:hypothetical protein